MMAVWLKKTNIRNYIHADRGDMPAERQVTWRGCARDWITNGQFGQVLNLKEKQREQVMWRVTRMLLEGAGCQT